VIEHLVHAYGAAYERVIAISDQVAGGKRRVHPDAPVIHAQLVFGVIEEDARTADDLLWRRTELGARGLITDDARRAAQSAFELSAMPTA
jgi:glycerol-3-phosphate dehydrogenase